MLGMEALFTPLVITFLLGLISITLFIWYFSRNHDYFKKLGIPYVKPLPLLGSVWENSTMAFHELENKRYKELGAIYGMFEGNRPLLSIAVPSLLRDVLVKDFHMFPNRRFFKTGDIILDNMVSSLFGEDWKRVRTVITPTFTTGKIRKTLNIFKESANSAIQNFKKEGKDGKPVDVKRIYGAFSMDVIASSAFSTKLDSHNDPENQFVQMSRKIFTRDISWRFVVFVLAPSIIKLFKISLFDPVATYFFRDVALKIIEERKRTGKKRNDFLQLLMDTAEEVESEQKLEEKESEEITSNYGKEGSALKGFKNISNKTLSMDEIVAQCVIFFIAGYDTAAVTLSYISYLLALNPDIQEKAREEVDRVLRENKNELTYEGLQSMKYLDNVISESLRIYPPAVRVERMAEADYELGDTGITIPKGMIISVPIYALHHDPNYFPDPEKFDPDRFAPEERGNRDQYTYMPFGVGPRNCVGMRFALMEVKVCLAMVLNSFIIKKCSQTKVPLDFYNNQQILQPKEIAVEMEPRKDAPAVK